MMGGLGYQYACILSQLQKADQMLETETCLFEIKRINKWKKEARVALDKIEDDFEHRSETKYGRFIFRKELTDR